MRHFYLAGLALATFPSVIPAQASCTLTPYGTGCGPRITGAIESHQNIPKLVVRLSGGARNGYGLQLLGVRKIELMIPGTNCRLLTDPLLAVPFRIDGNGDATLALELPLRTLLGLFVQDLAFDNVLLQTSNGLALSPCILDLVDEDFGVPVGRRDDARNGAIWARGKATPARAGGNGQLGDFDVRFGGVNTGKKDKDGRTIFEWNTESATIPAERTLSGKPIVVQNGIFQFLSFVLTDKQHLRFVGSKVPVIEVSGRIDIQGTISVSGASAVPPPRVGASGRTPELGQSGFKGGPGGGAGGKGGDQHQKSAAIHGLDGAKVQLPSGHPLQSASPVTAGKGSLSHPPTRHAAVVARLQISPGFFMVQMMPSGGGGGGCLTAGGDGALTRNTSPYQKGPIHPGDKGAIAKGGALLAGFDSLLTRPEASSFLYSIGGAGGGGAGSGPAGNFASSLPRVDWNSGGGGAGGGGVLQLESGGTLTLGSPGKLLAAGGDGSLNIGQIAPYYPAPGGSGSGGSVLLQTPLTLDLRGKVVATGGKTGLLGIDSFGGAGGDGYIRAEAGTKPDFKRFLNVFSPVATAKNVGTFRKVDEDPVSMLATLWYQTARISSPGYLYYVIEATVDGKKVLYSDGTPSSRRAAGNEPLVLFAQGAVLDLGTGQPKSVTAWSEGTVSPLNGKNGNAIRYLLRLDRSKTTTAQIEVHRARFYYRR
ncbi:MAG: hypothetical protein ACE5F1_04235 [Planctomycetota bacterium]